MVETVKFSDFIDAGNPGPTQNPVGLSVGTNARFTTWLPIMEPGPTGDRPAISSDIYYRLRFNTSLDVLSYEYYSPTQGEWITVNAGGDVDQIYVSLASHDPSFGASLIGLQDQTGVTSKTVQDLANASFIASTDNGTLKNATFLSNVPSGFVASTTSTGVVTSRILTGTANQIDIANGSGSANPLFSISSTLTLPGTLTLGGGTPIDSINTSTTMTGAADTNVPSSLAIKTYVDSSISGGAVTSIMGTVNQVLANATSGAPITGAVTLTLPQDISVSSNVTFAALKIDSLLGKTAGTALTVTPIAGQNLAIALSTTGNFVVNTSQLVVNTANGNVGMGYASPSSGLTVSGGLSLGVNATVSAGNARINGTISCGTMTTSTNSQIKAAGTMIATAITLAFVNEQIVPSGTTSAYSYYSVPSTIAAGFTLTNFQHFTANGVSLGAGSVITNQAGFSAEASMDSVAGINYGFIGKLVSSGALNYNIYMSGTAPNYMNGGLCIGSSLTSPPPNGLIVNSQIIMSASVPSASVSYRFYMDGAFGSQVTAIAHSVNPVFNSTTTTQGVGHSTLIGTAAASFTLPDLTHYLVQQGTIGAGSTITQQTGFNVTSGLIGGASNYAFRGQIPLTTNCWNLYMSGTANNYLQGSLNIGTPLPTGSSQFRIANGGAFTMAIIERNLTGANGDNSLLFKRSQGTATSPTAITDSMRLGQISFSGYGTSSYLGDSFTFEVIADGDFTSSNAGTHAFIYNTPNGSTSSAGIGIISSAGNWRFGDTIAIPSNRVEVASGNLSILTPGNTIKVARIVGTAGCSGTGAVLVAGTVTVNTASVSTGDIIFTSPTATGGTAGVVRYSIVNGVSFTLTSSSALDTSTYSWWIVKAA